MLFRSTVDSSGNVSVELTAPHDVRLGALAGGSIQVTALAELGDSPAADQWALWWAIGEDPDTTTTPDATYDFGPPPGIWRRALRESVGPFSGGDVVHLVVGIRDSTTGSVAVAAVETITAVVGSAPDVRGDRTFLGDEFGATDQ